MDSTGLVAFTELLRDLCGGFPIVGKMPANGMFPAKARPAGKQLREVLSRAKLVQKSVIAGIEQTKQRPPARRMSCPGLSPAKYYTYVVIGRV